MIARGPIVLGLLAGVAVADPGGDVLDRADGIVARCLACHLVADDRIDIVGLTALDGLPEEWPFLFEDAFDLDGDGIAGALRFVSGENGPQIGVFGQSLAAARFEDFAKIAAGVHGIEISGQMEMARVRAAFEALSPDPALPQAGDLQAFEARGCAACHVTRQFEHGGKSYMPLSDFLLHDLGGGPRRTTPLWGCPECLRAPAHAGSD